MGNSSIFREVLIRVYDDFYKKLTSDMYFSHFFKGKDVEQIKRKQIDNLIKSFKKFEEKDFDYLRKNYIELAKLHDELGLDFNSYTDAISELEVLILKEFFHFYKVHPEKNIDVERLFIDFEEFFDLVRQYSAVGYLENLVKREKTIINDFIEANIDYKLHEIKDLIDKHIDWKEKILDFLLGEKDLSVEDVKHYKCEMSKWLEDKKKSIKSKKLKEKIEKLIVLHKNLHFIAEKIVELKKEDKIFQLVYEYNDFIKLSLVFLSSIIAFATSEEINKLQRDPLTNLLSKRLLKDIFTSIMDLSILSGEPFAVAFLDIDNFKKINDTYGHLVGDEVLKALAKALKEELRGSDYLFRYGGEEFVIILPSIKSINSLHNILEKLRKKIENIRIIVNNNTIKFTVSIGAVLVKESRRVPLTSVIEQADKLMYQAKKKGKNRVIVDVFKL